MEKVNLSEQKNLIIELSQGREMANELKKQLDPVTISAESTCEALVEKILSTYDKALSILTWRAAKNEILPRIALVDSPQSHFSAATSPIIESSNDGSLNDQRFHKNLCKKRKTLPKWSEQVRTCSEAGLDGPLDDGHSWRKYGQKDILGAKHPRAYYRCTHRISRGCLATKQVQRSDEDPSMVEVTYKGRHSCNSSSEMISNAKEMPIPKKARLLEEDDTQRQAQRRHDLKLETEEENFPSFSFSFTGVGSENLECPFFSDIVKETDTMGSYSPPFLSPTTSESNYFSSSCQMDNNFGYNILQTSESTPTQTSVINSSPFADLGYSIDQVDFDPSFLLDDALAYFS